MYRERDVYTCTHMPGPERRVATTQRRCCKTRTISVAPPGCYYGIYYY